MKKLSIILPTYNEEDNVLPLTNTILNILNSQLSNYDYEIIFSDNCSTDSTRDKIIDLCNKNKKIKAIFNVKNFGQVRSPHNAILSASGDCVLIMASDFQDPPEMIPQFVCEWENGNNIVIGIKTKSKENLIMRFIRTIYYKLINSISEIDHIDHFTGFGLYDKSFIDVLRQLNDPEPYMRGIVAELGYKIKKIEFTQPRRKFGISKNNFYSLYHIAMLGVTSYSKIPLRIATICGFISSGISFVFGLIYFIYKLIFWNSFNAGIAPLILGVFFIGSIQLFFIGLLGEYVLSINTRIIKRPLVIEWLKLYVKLFIINIMFLLK